MLLPSFLTIRIISKDRDYGFFIIFYRHWFASDDLFRVATNTIRMDGSMGMGSQYSIVDFCIVELIGTSTHTG